MPDGAQKVYGGYTADELAKHYNPAPLVPDLPAYQQWNAEESKRVAARIKHERDIAYGEAAIQKLDIYPAAKSGAPVLIDLHGGGWTAGSKNARAYPAEAVVGRGVTWVPIDYGLAPTFKMDAIVDHVRQAVAWVSKNIQRYGGDPKRIFVSGNSAGGHLAATTVMAGWHAKYGVPEDVVKGACAMSGVYDLNPLRLASHGPNEQLQMDEAEAKRNSPIFAIAKSQRPMIVAWGAPETEGFKSQGINYVKALKEANIDVTEVVVPGAHHYAMSREIMNRDSEIHSAIMKMIGV
jgi:arylformamidase